jgi:hypothetical protein
MSARRHAPLLPALLALAALAATALPMPAEAALRCGTRLVNEGDSAGELFAHCGEPTAVDRKTILQPPVIWRHGRPVRVGGGAIEVQVEFWTYNFGPNQLMRRIRIEDGRVKSIETLGYGYL